MKRYLILLMVLGLIAGSVATVEAKKGPRRVAGPARMLAAVRGHTYYPSIGPDGVVVARHSGGLDLLNLDEHSHTLTSVAWKNGRRLFDSGSVAQGTNREVRGVEKLPMGRYRFFCTSHPEMRGTLEVRHI